MRILDMQTFTALVRNRHFGRTAQELSTTQPAISSRLAALEQELGHKLVHRMGSEFRLPPEGEEVLRVFQGVLDNIDVLTADVSSEADVSRVIDHTLSRHGRIDGLVNNAAIGPLGTVLNTPPERFARIFEVNVQGVYLMCRAVIPHMVSRGGGAIVNIGSGAGYGKPNMAAYAASKGALLALSTAMAYDHFHDRVRVNVAIPGGGGIVSGMSVGRFGGDEALFTSLKVAGTVAGRPANGTDLARTVAFLLSMDAATVSGTVVDVGCFAHQGGPLLISA